MKNHFHGIDLHKQYATINVRNQAGVEIETILRCKDFQSYIDSLSEQDSVIFESINNAFFWADRIEDTGASVIIVNPYKFKIIKESWNKTDKRDAANLSLALWMSELRHEFKLPVVYKPDKKIRELRKLFSYYSTITSQITQSIIHIIESSDMMREFYFNVKQRRGTGRSRIAVIRKIFNIMRRMILTGELYRGCDDTGYQKKLKEFDTIIKKAA